MMGLVIILTGAVNRYIVCAVLTQNHVVKGAHYT